MALFDRFKRKELADNQPKKPELDKEVGVAGQLVFTGLDKEEKRSDNITIEKYRKMVDTDDTAEAIYLILTLPILATEYRIDADKDDSGETQAIFVRENLLEPPHKGGIETPLDLVLAQLLQGTIDGFALFNRVYTLNKQEQIVYKRLAYRDSIGITLYRDKHGGYAGARQDVNYDGQHIDEKFGPEETFLFTYDKARGFLYGRSAFKTAYTNYDRKRRLEYLDGIGLQNDAIKAKILRRTESGALGTVGKKAKNLALAALSKLGELKPVAAIPYGWDVKELNSEGRDPGPSIERQNAGMARSVLAQFIMLGTQGKSGVGSYALSENQSDIFMIALKGLMQNIEHHINFYLIPDIIGLNFSEPAYPEFHFNDMTNKTWTLMKDAFMKLIEKDKLTDEFVQGILNNMAAELGIDVEKIRKDLEKARKKAEKEQENKPKPPTPPNPGNPEGGNDDKGGQGGNAGNGNKFPGPDLADLQNDDFLEVCRAVGKHPDDLGCLMLDVEPFEVTKYVDGGEDDLFFGESYKQGAVAEKSAHVTLLYGFLENAHTWRPIIDKALDDWSLDKVKIEKVTYFDDPDDESYTIVALVDKTPELLEGRKRVARLPYADRFSEYKPHLTLAYVKNDEAIRDKWVKALGERFDGKTIKLRPDLNYGTPPGVKKSLSELSENTKWFRELTLAEKQVDFAQMQRKLNGFEKEFAEGIKPLYDQIKDEALKSLTTILEKKDINALNDFQLKHAVEYRDIIAKTMKSTYEFAKTATSDEMKLPAPSTKRETTAIINQDAQSVADKQLSDLVFIIKSEVIKELRKNNLADVELGVADLLAVIEGLLNTFFDNKVSMTGAIVASQAIDRARFDVFNTHRDKIAAFQYSAILDHKTCPICSALDGKVVSYADYRATAFKPPIHAWCRCIWVAIKKDQAEIPEITGLPERPGGVEAPLL